MITKEILLFITEQERGSLLLDNQSGSDYSGDHRHSVKELFAGLS